MNYNQFAKLFSLFSGDIQKNPSMDYKSNSSCSSPGKQEKSTLERMDRGDRHPAFGTPVPVLPVRNNLRAAHFAPTASRFHFRKGLSSRCSWKCTAIVFIMLFVLLLAIASYMSGNSLWILLEILKLLLHMHIQTRSAQLN